MINPRVQQLSAMARKAVPAKDWLAVRSNARKILRIDKRSAEGHFLLGLALKGLGRSTEAVQSLRRALGFHGGRYDAAVEMAELLLRSHRYGEIAELLASQGDAMMNSPLYLDRAASLLLKIGLPERAWPLVRRANELQPGVDSLKARMAECATYVGEVDVARQLYRELLDRNPAHRRNHYELSRLARAENRDHVDEMMRVIASDQSTPEANIYAYYALGKELEDLGDWNAAFDYYKRAGDAISAGAEYDVREDVSLIETVIETFSPDWFEQTLGAPPDDRETPIFIVGLPRTGTTLTERILSSHSAVGSVGESFFVQIAVKETSGIKSDDAMSPAIIRAAAKGKMKLIARRYRDAIKYRLPAKPMFIEKLPENLLYVGLLTKAFPDAKIILQTRNPMDACFAMYKQSYFRYAYNLDDLGEYYVAYQRLHDHWCSVLADRVVHVNYENMIRNQESETRRLLQALGLAFEDACLDFEQNKTASNTASSVQIREKIHTRSLQKWTRFKSQLEPLQRRLERAGISTD